MGVNRDQGGGGLLMAPLFVTRYHTSQSHTQTRGSCMGNFIKSNNKITPLMSLFNHILYFPIR